MYSRATVLYENHNLWSCRVLNQESIPLRCWILTISCNSVCTHTYWMSPLSIRSSTWSIQTKPLSQRKKFKKFSRKISKHKVSHPWNHVNHVSLMQESPQKFFVRFSPSSESRENICDSINVFRACSTTVDSSFDPQHALCYICDALNSDMMPPFEPATLKALVGQIYVEYRYQLTDRYFTIKTSLDFSYTINQSVRTSYYDDSSSNVGHMCYSMISAFHVLFSSSYLCFWAELSSLVSLSNSLTNRWKSCFRIRIPNCFRRSKINWFRIDLWFIRRCAWLWAKIPIDQKWSQTKERRFKKTAQGIEE